MFYRHSVDKLIYPALVFVILLAVSYHPKYRLRSEMPRAFFSDNADKGDKDRTTSFEKRTAWAYWKSAQMNIQWQYPHGSILPADPPSEFRVEANALGSDASDPVLRAFYWHRLQQVWPLPDAWKEQYQFSFDWASDPIASASQWLRDRADRWFTIR